MKSIKGKLQETNPDRVPIFEKNAAAFAKTVVANFKDYEFYTGESMNPDGMVALLNYREDGTTRKLTFFATRQKPLIDLSWVAFFTFWKDGVKEVRPTNSITRSLN